MRSTAWPIAPVGLYWRPGPFAIDHDKGVINLLEATFERPRCDALVSRLLAKVRCCALIRPRADCGRKPTFTHFQREEALVRRGHKLLIIDFATTDALELLRFLSRSWRWEACFG